MRMCFLFHRLFFLLLLIYCLNYYGSRIKFNFWCLKSNFVAHFFPSKFLSYFHLIKLCHCYSNILNKCIWWTFEQPKFEWHRSTYVWIFSSFPVKSFIVFTGLMAWERPRWLKSCLQGEPQAEALALRGMPGDPSKPARLLRLLGVLEGEPFQEILIQPSLGTKSVEFTRWSPSS